MPPSVWIGFDARESAAFAVARNSIRRRCNSPLPIHGLILEDLQTQGLYTRPTERRHGRLYDELSRRDDYDGAMSTEFAISRFTVPYLAKRGWALFMDCDMLVRANLMPMFSGLDPKFALYCVKHDHRPEEKVKMDGQSQTVYARKNWSSFMIFNCEHPANKALTVEVINKLPGRELHRMCWLRDYQIGELPPTYNYLVGHTHGVDDPKVVHFTDGIPTMPGFHDVEYADEWRASLNEWAR